MQHRLGDKQTAHPKVAIYNLINDKLMSGDKLVVTVFVRNYSRIFAFQSVHFQSLHFSVIISYSLTNMTMETYKSELTNIHLFGPQDL